MICTVSRNDYFHLTPEGQCSLYYCSPYSGTLTYFHSPIHQVAVCTQLVCEPPINKREVERMRGSIFVDISERKSRATLSPAFVLYQLWLCRFAVTDKILLSHSKQWSTSVFRYDWLQIQPMAQVPSRPQDSSSERSNQNEVDFGVKCSQ